MKQRTLSSVQTFWMKFIFSTIWISMFALGTLGLFLGVFMARTMKLRQVRRNGCFWQCGLLAPYVFGCFADDSKGFALMILPSTFQIISRKFGFHWMQF